jgi:hypothetical protein
MMGRQMGDQSQLFYLFNLGERIPARHLLRRINPIVTRVLGDLREMLRPFYSEIGRPSIDPELQPISSSAALKQVYFGKCWRDNLADWAAAQPNGSKPVSGWRSGRHPSLGGDARSW